MGNLFGEQLFEREDVDDNEDLKVVKVDDSNEFALPNAYIKSINQLGLVEIRFTK